MQYHFEYDPDGKILTGTTSGSATIADLYRYADALAEHPKLSDCLGIISDHRKIRLSEFSYSEVRGLVDYSSKYAEKVQGLKNAFVVERTVDLGMVRMYEGLGDSKFERTIQVFSSLEEARDWLGTEKS